MALAPLTKTIHDDPATELDADVERMLRIQRDEPGAFTDLLECYWSRIFGRFYHQFGDRQEAEDLTQEVFLRLYRNRKRYRPEAKFATWLFHIARNVARNAIRTKRRRHLTPLGWMVGEEPNYISQPLIQGSESPSQSLERAELAKVVRAAVSTLLDRQRQAVELQFQEHTYSEIAEELAMTPKAAKSLLYRARNQLRLSLGSVVESLR